MPCSLHHDLVIFWLMRFAAKVQHPSCWQLHGGRGLGQAVETLRLLINSKADLTARCDRPRETALGAAVRKKKSDVVAFLTSLGAPM